MLKVVMHMINYYNKNVTNFFIYYINSCQLYWQFHYLCYRSLKYSLSFSFKLSMLKYYKENQDWKYANQFVQISLQLNYVLIYHGQKACSVEFSFIVICTWILFMKFV